MSDIRQLLNSSVEEAYVRASGPVRSADPDLRAGVLRRGRRRRIARIVGSAALVVVIATGAAASVGLIRDGQERLEAVDNPAPTMGAEKIMEFGGPMAVSNDALLVANDYLESAEGDKASIARFDLVSHEVTNTDPISLVTPDEVALGTSGLWSVRWSGSTSDDGHAHGKIRLVDPVAGKVVLDLPREDSAPNDVAVAEVDGREMAWVVDAVRDQLLKVDATTGEIEAIELEPNPRSLTVGAGAVWVASLGSTGKDGALSRYDLADGSLQVFPVDHCLTDLVVLDGSLWASDSCDGAVHRFDATSGEELALVTVGGTPSAIATGAGLVWVAGHDEVIRIDPERNEVVGDSIVVPDLGVFGGYIAVADDTVFASTFSGVYRLGEGLPIQERPPTPAPEESHTDPLSSETCSLDNVMCIPLDREMSIAGAGFGSAWVGNVGEGATFGIARFDAETGEEIARLSTNGFVQGFAPDEESMWALLDRDEHLTLLKIDPTSTTVRSSYDIGRAGNIGEPSLVAGGGFVWVSQPRGSVTRVSLVDGKLTTRSYAEELPGYVDDSGPLHLAYGEDRLWLSYGRGHLGVVDPLSGELLRLDQDALGQNAYEIIVAAGEVWSSHQSPNGDNEISYTATSGPDGAYDRVLLLDAAPGLAATDGDHIWVVQDSFSEKGPGWLVEVDARTHERVGKPLKVDIGFMGGVAVGDGFVWVTGDRVLYRIDPT